MADIQLVNRRQIAFCRNPYYTSLRKE